MLGLVLLSVLPAALGAADPLITPAARLVDRSPQATTASAMSDPSFVGYVSESGTFNNPRSCAYPQTVSTSGSYFQCCNATGPCAFYTSCSANTLFAASATVACDVDPALACNTAVVEASVGDSSGASYLACWQTSLGSAPFTFVQDIGTAVPALGTNGSVSTEASSTGQETGASETSVVHLSGTRTPAASVGGSTVSSSASAQGSSSTGKGAAAGVKVGIVEGGVIGLLGYLAQMLV